MHSIVTLAYNLVKCQGYNPLSNKNGIDRDFSLRDILRNQHICKR